MAADVKLINILNERSLLGLFLELPVLQELVELFPPQTFEQGALIFVEGQPATHLGIILTGKARLASVGTDGSPIGLGDLIPYRSANLYSVIRGLPFQYSVVAAEKTEVLIIPWERLSSYFRAKPFLEGYLEFMTGTPVARQIRREIDDLECQKDFRTEFIGSLTQKTIPPEAWIAQQGELMSSAFFLTEGTAQVFQRADNKASGSLWAIPKNSWQLWAECLDGSVLKYSFRSLLNVQAFFVEKKRLEEIRAKYPDDFKKYDQWVRGATRNSSETDDRGTEIESLTELFPKLENKRGSYQKYPHVFQNDSMDCGPACLTMISKYYGKNTSIQFWRERVFTNQEGTSLFDLAKTTERNGFISHGIGVDHLREIEASYLPCIALRKYHYLVIYELRQDTVLLGDPAVGIYEMKLSEFEEGFEKALLVLKPNEDFSKLPTSKQGFSHYFGLFQGLSKEILCIFACSIILVLFSLFPPFLSQIIVDEVLSKKDLKLLAIVLGGAFLAVLCQGFSYWLREYYIYFLTSKFDFRSTSAFLRKVFSLPYTFFATRHVGDFTRRLSELERLRSFFSSVLVATILDLAVLILYAIVLFLYSPIVAVVGFVAAPLTIVFAHFFSIRLRTKYSEVFTRRAKQESLLTDLVKGAGTIKILNGEVASRWRFEERLTKTLQSQYSYSMTGAGLASFTDAYSQIMKYGLMGFGAYWGVKGDLSPGQVIAISMLVGQIIDPFKSMAHNWSSFQEMKTILSRLDDVFLATSEVIPGKRGLIKSKLTGEIEFQNVWFRYGGDSSEWVLKGASFKIKPGQHVAIVGPSGCGKSTIAHLLARLYEPTSGTIFIDGRDYREYDVNWLRSQIGLLQQEPCLFHGTIAENIAFGQPEFLETDLIKMSKMADAHNFISEKSLGYQYMITYGGLGLSGGQKQRLALARTLYARPSLVVLDEATSMLDGISESNLLKNVYSNYKETTILSIAHRYSTAKASDFALVMENGRVAGFGTHENLEAEDGLYTQLFGLRIRRAA